MLIDCHGCAMRDIACSDCVVTSLLGPISESLEDHRETFDILAASGLSAPLRLVSSLAHSDTKHDEHGDVVPGAEQAI